MRQAWSRASKRAMAIPFLVILVAGAAQVRPVRVKDHDGRQGDPKNAGKRIDCTDKDKTEPNERLVTLHAKYNGHSLSITEGQPGITAFFESAFATCFIRDTENDQLLGPNAPTFVSGEVGEASVEIAPASHVHKMKVGDLKDNSKGYFVLETRTRSNTRHTGVFIGDSEITIGEGASTLLFYGRDDEGHKYLAELDLGSFPTTIPREAKIIRVIRVGQLIEGPHKSSHVAQFARFADPKHLVNRTYPDGTWIGCTPGCCVAAGMVLQSSQEHSDALRRRKS